MLVFLSRPSQWCVLWYRTRWRLGLAPLCHTPREEFARCLRGMRVSLNVREGERLFSALLPTTTDAAGARYPELVNFLRSKNAKWFDVERGIADKVVRLRGGLVTSGQRQYCRATFVITAGVAAEQRVLRPLPRRVTAELWCRFREKNQMLCTAHNPWAVECYSLAVATYPQDAFSVWQSCG